MRGMVYCGSLIQGTVHHDREAQQPELEATDHNVSIIQKMRAMDAY